VLDKHPASHQNTTWVDNYAASPYANHTQQPTKSGSVTSAAFIVYTQDQQGTLMQQTASSRGYITRLGG
jgi:hypothetical protein